MGLQAHRRHRPALGRRRIEQASLQGDEGGEAAAEAAGAQCQTSTKRRDCSSCYRSRRTSCGKPTDLYIHIPAHGWWYAVTVIDYFSRNLLACHFTPSYRAVAAALDKARAESERLHGPLAKTPFPVTDDSSGFLARAFQRHIDGGLRACAHPVSYADPTRAARTLLSDAEIRGGVLEALCLARGGDRLARSGPTPLQRGWSTLGADPERRWRRRRAGERLCPRSDGATAKVAGLGGGGEKKAREADRHVLPVIAGRRSANRSDAVMEPNGSRSHQRGRTSPPLAHRAACVRGQGRRGQGVERSGVAIPNIEPNFACPLEFGAKTCWALLWH